MKAAAASGAADCRIAHLLDAMGLQDAFQRALVVAIYGLAKDQFPEAQESLKYGGIQLSMPVPFCGIYAYSRHVSVELSHGAKIAGPSMDLEGKGLYRRHIKLHSLEDIRSKHLAHYLPLALRAALAAA